ncbi:hypothetical protein D9615_000340 [Tricholomella constricta]|uniref:Uncharacterized protein n=1 Tax=Tricholomella constricta TaxID=117010 RepID=A0A8H5MBZ6_9AGAR|nr:hypothetical protein D9615_000340 [Tricholomella constricta]
MSSVANAAQVSSRLGDYLLKGWVLTDRSCKTPRCGVPLMRSPNGRTPIVLFCVNCDDTPGVTRPNPTINTSDSASSVASEFHVSRSSTPPTEVSSALSSPVFAPPADTEETRRRREQSDTASAEIGKRLLKGWAMLGDECPNPRCYGVPLVRPTKAGGGKNPRKECVVCGGVYVTEVDWAGRERLIPAGSDILQPNNNSTATISTPVQDPTPQELPHAFTAAQEPILVVPPVASTSAVYPKPERSLMRISDPLQALEESSLALQSTLHVLSARLGALSGPSAVTDPSAIGLIADAIGKVTQALSQVRQLQWSETQAQRL